MVMVNVLKRPVSSSAWILESPLQIGGRALRCLLTTSFEGPADTCMPGLLPLRN